MSRAVAVAHPNIALAKYWGKRARPGNFPAVPSLSVTLDGMSTRTEVVFDAALGADELVLGGRAAPRDDGARVAELLDRVRAASGERRFARVTSANDFPTGSGLASSASGFAALALAAVAAAGLEWPESRVSDLARRGSASAARSVFGGFVELLAGAESGSEEDVLAARPVAASDALDLRVLACVVTEQPKDESSRAGMRLTAERSPYYATWLESSPRTFESMKHALGARDFARVGELAEQSALAMHACALAAGVIYLRGVSLELWQRVRELRAAGLRAYATADAGPHVKVLVQGADAARAKRELEAQPGVLRVIDSGVGAGARLIEGPP